MSGVKGRSGVWVRSAEYRKKISISMMGKNTKLGVKRPRPNWKYKSRDELLAHDAEYQRQKRKLHPEIIREYQKKYKEKYPERDKAHTAVHRALKTGRLKKDKCRDCERIDTHGHHADYNKPLEVIWLCPIHHKVEDLLLKSSRLNKEK